MKRLLIADDDQVFAKLLSMEFEQQDADVELVTAENGRQAMDLIAASRPDLLLLDLRMPIEDGFLVLEKLKQLHSDLPVIVMTHFRNDDFLSRCQAMGAKDYLVKGDLRIDQMVEKVRGHL